MFFVGNGDVVLRIRLIIRLHIRNGSGTFSVSNKNEVDNYGNNCKLISYNQRTYDNGKLIILKELYFLSVATSWRAIININ
jgi:hypothetical protein